MTKSEVQDILNKAADALEASGLRNVFVGIATDKVQACQSRHVNPEEIDDFAKYLMRVLFEGLCPACKASIMLDFIRQLSQSE